MGPKYRAITEMPHNLKFVRYKVHHEDRRYTKKERKHHVRVTCVQTLCGQEQA